MSQNDKFKTLEFSPTKLNSAQNNIREPDTIKSIRENKNYPNQSAGSENWKAKSPENPDR